MRLNALKTLKIATGLMYIKSYFDLKIDKLLCDYNQYEYSVKLNATGV